MSDSLAAESLADGGSFADGHATASKQPSKGTTANNYDTSAATTLDPASDAEARLAAEEWSETAQLKAGQGLKSGGEYDGSLGRSEGESGDSAAPTDTQKPVERHDRPHGKNLTEGGFDSSAPNASFNQEIGGKNDPGRLAEEKFTRDNAYNPAGAAFEGGREKKSDSEGQYDVLGDEAA
jgi:hypothetical protein